MTAARSLPLATPHTRGECVGGVRPCPFYACRHHIQNGPAPASLDSCSLDVADRTEPPTLAEVGAMFGVTRQAIEQMEAKGLATMRRRMDPDALAAWTDLRPSLPDAGFEDLVDPEFKAAVHRAYVRIVPADERGANAMRSLTRSPR